MGASPPGHLCIRESVDSLCRDGADAQYMQYLLQKPYNVTTNTLNAYLSIQPSSLRAFMISKTHTVSQKQRERQLNTRVCGSKSAIFLILCSDHLSNNDNSKTAQVLTLILARNRCSSQHAACQPLSVFIASNLPWSKKLFTALPDCCPLRRTPFSNLVRTHIMRTCSLVPKPRSLLWERD